MKTVLKEGGFPVLDCLRFNRRNIKREACIEAVEKKIPYPVIVKPVNLGSSIGISKADDRNELYSSLETAFSYASKVLIERAVQNLKEINCSVRGDYENADASACEEPVSSDKILTFAEKYIGDGSAKGAKGGVKGGVKSSASGSKGMATLKRKIPADITDAQRDEIRTLAVKAFKCLGCNGVSRIDFMMDTKTGNIWLNEINTIPGSLAFYLWKEAGMSFTELMDALVKQAIDRQRRREKRITSFDAITSSSIPLILSSKSPRYFAPAISAPMSRAISWRSFRVLGTSPRTMRWARPSAMAVLPTPGSPIRQGLFF